LDYNLLSKVAINRTRELIESDTKSLRSNARILTARRGKRVAKDHQNMKSQYFENYPYKSQDREFVYVKKNLFDYPQYEVNE